MSRALLLILVVALTPASVRAATPDGAFSLGFMRSEAPLGVRVWVSETVAIDGGFGFATHNDGDLTDVTFNLAVPVTLIPTDRVNLNLVPGGLVTVAGNPGDVDSDTRFTIYAGLEAEVFLSGNLSVSAAHGLNLTVFSPGAEGADSSTDFGTVGFNFTTFGFHFYLPDS